MPKNLAKGVRALKRQSEDALKAAAEGQQNQADQERLRELEAQNREMEGTLRSMGEVLHQHTRQWAISRMMLEKLQDLASPSIFVLGHAFLRGLQNQQPTEMASLLLHMLAPLLSTLGERIPKLKSLVVWVKSSFGVVVPAYYWDKGQKTFEWVLKAGELAPAKFMSTIPWYPLISKPGRPVMPHLQHIQEWQKLVQGGSNNSFGPDLNRPQQ